jgi:DNA-binding CsgD family transcriptional regulator
MPRRRSRRSRASGGSSQKEDRPRLTPRELECLGWVAEDKSAGDIATILGRSVHTVRHHLRRTYAKLGVNSRATAVERARELKLLKRPRRRKR